MLEFESDNGFRKIKLWNNEMPFNYISNKNMSLTIDAGDETWYEGTLCLEAKLNPRHASNYAMICMKYTYVQCSKTQIIIHYGIEYIDKKKNELFNKNAIVGLDDFMAKAIYDIFGECASESFPCGVLEVIGGAYDEVGSSYMSFKRIVELMIWIFSNYSKIDNEELGNKILNKMRLLA